MSAPAFSDIAKPANDLLSRDFYHLAPASLEIKTKAPNGVAFTVKGKSSDKDGSISASIEGKFAEKSTGIVLTQGWNTANVINSKIELADAFTPGLKVEILSTLLPDTKAKSAKINFHFKQPGFHSRAFFDLLNPKGSNFTGDATYLQNGFLVGSEFGYDIANGNITKYASALGYAAPSYTAALTSTSNFTVFSGSYAHRVSPFTEVGAKSVWDSNSSKPVSLEVGVKHVLDAGAFVKAKINSQAVAAVSYSQVLRPGVKLGLGISVDTQKLGESAHKLGGSLTFEA